MLVRSSLFVLIILFIDWSSAVGQNLAVTRSANRQCEPIGRVLSNGDRRYQAGSLLCSGDRLQPPNGTTVEILCYLNRKVLWLSSGVVSDKCTPQAKQQAQQCTRIHRVNCPSPKGPGSNSNTPEIVSPYSSALLNGRPLLSWYPVPGATSYTVEVSGEGVEWGKTVESTTLEYPNEQPTMQFGNAYRVTVTANQGEETISASVSVFNMLPESEARQVMELVERINSLKLPKDEVAFLDLDSIYRSFNLLTQTISTLQAQVKDGSQKPGLYRVLGDRYLEAGLPDYALSKYETATRLAQTADNPIELAKARAGLKLIARASTTISWPRRQP